MKAFLDDLNAAVDKLNEHGHVNMRLEIGRHEYSALLKHLAVPGATKVIVPVVTWQGIAEVEIRSGKWRR